MSRFGSAWNEFWFAAGDPYRLGLFRIVLGIHLLWYLGVLFPHVPALFSDVGVHVPYGWYTAAPPLPVAFALFGGTWLVALLFTLGYRTRLVTPLLLVGFLHHYFLYFAVKHASYDRLIIVCLVVLCCVDAGRALSLDAKAGRASGSPIPIWAERILRFQTIALYFGSGLWKLANPAWRTGAFLESAMQGMWSTPVGFWLVQQGWSPLAWALASWSVIGVELGAGVFLLRRRSRAVAAGALALFHLANTVILFVPEFLVCLAPLVLFVPRDVIRRGANLFGSRLLDTRLDVGEMLQPSRAVSQHLDRCS